MVFLEWFYNHVQLCCMDNSDSGLALSKANENFNASLTCFRQYVVYRTVAPAANGHTVTGKQLGQKDAVNGNSIRAVASLANAGLKISTIKHTRTIHRATVAKLATLRLLAPGSSKNTVCHDIGEAMLTNRRRLQRT
ncbi:ATPase [Anopheles sinensis]|uniref:ATPase n=1 Tax=Anopheles sinensis TaxID=74873 RepID=A0A084VVX6_ANOSI|nr:ATPase [Anopheles sinensis]